ncbi:MAG: 4-hydroxythreonine-4-phosphate dehydrogenase PdxA [Planctomycetota bacterium]|jgi:4-hydroxythreonine-4-phosphate dehydrogenase
MGKTARIAVTLGDPFGVGPEVASAAAAASPHDITLFGPAEFVPGAQRVIDVPVKGARPERPGPSAAGGRAALDALERALHAVASGAFDALVTAPISKESCGLADGPTDGHTPLLGQFFDVAEPLMAFAWADDEPVVALLTTHIPLRAVPATLTSERVERATILLHGELKRRFGRPDPVIGVLGLNPHAGEAGLMGTEEADFIAPALARLAEAGVKVEGPLPADTAFAVRQRFDGLLAMYHDQGLAPVKALAFDRAVNITLGLPTVRTSPCHGTAFDLAGTGRASPTSMAAALDWAGRLARSTSAAP